MSAFFIENEIDMKIAAYKCVDTGKIFESMSAYRLHRARHLAKKKVESDQQAKRDKVKASLDHLRNTATTTSEISEWIINNCYSLAFYNNIKLTDNFRIITVDFNLTWQSRCSNSHSAPLNGVRNWGATTSDLPANYPGVCGRIAIKYSGNTNAFFSNIFKGTGINFGTGGGGGANYASDIIMFAADWPALTESLLGIQVWHELRDGYHNINA